MSKKKYLLIALLFLFVCVFNTSRSLLSPPSHDEDQFIVSAALFAKDGLLPYLDYPYFHLPNLIFIYAGLFDIVGQPFLVARIFSAFSNTLTASILFLFIRSIFNRNHSKHADIISALWVLTFITNPFYLTASPLAWNHAFAGLALTASYWFFHHSFVAIKKHYWLFFTGIFLSIAVGTRATMVFAIIPYLLAIYIYSVKNTHISLFNLVSPFLVGFFIPTIPSIILFLQAPGSFLFGTIQYANLNTLFRFDNGFPGPFTFYEKLSFLLELFLENPSNLLVVMLALFYGGMNIIPRKPDHNPIQQNCLLPLSVILFLSIGSFLPTPSWPQYFYAPIPFVIIFGALCMSVSIKNYPQLQKITYLTMLVVSILSIILTANEIRQIQLIIDKNNWQTTYVHIVGNKLKQTVKTGIVLTLSPVYAVEAGLDIYPQLATGPFAWRTAQFLNPEQIDEFAILGEFNLSEVFSTNPPTAILVGLEPEYEASISRYAKQNGYTFQYFLDPLHLWIRDARP